MPSQEETRGRKASCHSILSAFLITLIVAMSIDNLRVLVVFIVVQVCLLAMMASPWTVQGRPVSTLFQGPPYCCPRFPDCCGANGSMEAKPWIDCPLPWSAACLRFSQSPACFVAVLLISGSVILHSVSVYKTSLQFKLNCQQRLITRYKQWLCSCIRISSNKMGGD